MEDRGNLEEYFRQRLANAEMDVNPKLWGALEQALVNKAASSATASIGLAKVAGAIAFSGLIAMASINEIKYQQRFDETVSQSVDITMDHSSPEKHTISQDQEANVKADSDNKALENYAVKSPSDQVNEAELLQPTKQKSADAEGVNKVAEKGAEISDQTAASATNMFKVETPAPPTQQEHLNNTAISKAVDEPKSEEHADESLTTLSKAQALTSPVSEPEQRATTIASFTHDAVQTITPNGDMFNEYFVVEGLDVAEFHIRIMTREGALVAESKDLNFRWNGLDRFGNPVPSGTYFYQIAAVGTDGLPYLEKNARGSIQVIRD